MKMYGLVLRVVLPVIEAILAPRALGHLIARPAQPASKLATSPSASGRTPYLLMATSNFPKDSQTLLIFLTTLTMWSGQEPSPERQAVTALELTVRLLTVEILMARASLHAVLVNLQHKLK